ncbi:hypothetical protein A2U01_0027061, partial [Trifolium medium]|nr:hypothetical protein [Trifolium medium]
MVKSHFTRPDGSVNGSKYWPGLLGFQIRGSMATSETNSASTDLEICTLKFTTIESVTFFRQRTHVAFT